MKNQRFIISFLAASMLLGGCQKNDDANKINMSIGDKNITTFVDATYDKIETMMDNEDSFIVYVYSKSCGSCADVSPRVEEIIGDYGITIYRTLYSSLPDSSPLKLSSGTPILGFYKDGRRLKIVGYSEKTQKQFATKDALLSLFRKYVVLPENIYYISLEELKRLKDTNQSFVVIYSRASCGDCQVMRQKFFDNYALHNAGKHIYLLECDVKGIRFSLQDGNLVYDETQWITFKNEWKLTESAEATYGYGQGYVPTAQYYQNGNLAAANVYLNDTYSSLPNGSEIEGKSITYTLTITDSYYDEFIGQTTSATFTFQSETYQSNLYAKYREFALPFHNNKLENFLNTFAQ